MAFEKRSLSLSGHRTSLALEPEFWAVLDAAILARGQSLASLIGEIDEARTLAMSEQPLSSAVRVWALSYVQASSEGSS
ncbi:ribbon-helix-helix domain-containing protein [Woodsholea maritima]|uniref:ribbon-helix-helix domain-containing protein n=1 Tax=Woodsholea maritima TaxID=240237 RepID=UPI000376923E|nr:ribbon-helix-helix domain-containing protein [Woodsholea maritima]